MNERGFKKEFATLLRSALNAKIDLATPAATGAEKSTIKPGNKARPGIDAGDNMYDSEESEEEEYLDDDDDGEDAHPSEDVQEVEGDVHEDPDLNEEILRTIGPPNSLEFEHVKRN